MVCILYGKDYETIADLVEEMHRDFLNVADKIVNDKTHFNSGERRGRSGKSPAFRPWDESEALPASDMLNDNYLVPMQY